MNSVWEVKPQMEIDTVCQGISFQGHVGFFDGISEVWK